MTKSGWLKLSIGLSLFAASSVIIWSLCIKPRLMSDKAFLELVQAPIWGGLQSLEFGKRVPADAVAPFVLRNAVDSGEHDVLGLANSRAGRPTIWLLLDVDAGVNGVYVMPPQESFYIECGYLAALENQVRLNTNVKDFLLSKCRK